MNLSYLFRAGVVATALLALVGCSTFERRSQERSATFNQLDDATKERLKRREIFVGDTFDMVYIALGAPDERRRSVTAAGDATTWIYNRYWQEYEGERMVGYQRRVVYNPRTKSCIVFYEPVRQAVYQERVEERLRVYFKDGQVTAIEQAAQ
jgi:hypothetical protein